MVGFVVITHGELASELISTAEEIVGKLDEVKGLSIPHGCPPDEARELISATIQSVDNGDGVLILTDLFGGTPSNLSISFLEDQKLEVVTGVNLPMMIKLSSVKQKMPLDDLAQYIQSYGRENISIAGRLLKETT